jgi:endoglucanase
MSQRKAFTTLTAICIAIASCISAAAPAHAVGDPAVSIGSASVVEGQMTHRYVKFVVTLARPSTSVVTVQYATADGTATLAGIDYKAKSGTLTFKPGQTSKGIAVLVWPDRVDESDEQFVAALTNPVNAQLGVDTGVGTIYDDDPNVGPRVSIGDAAISETCAGPKVRAIVVVTLSIMQTTPVVVQVSTASGTAQSGVDFLPFNKTITFTASQSLKEVKIPIIPDQLVEGTESLTVNLSVVSGPVPASRTVGSVDIRDCDPS